MSYKKITVNVTYVITQYTFATTHIYALINENPQVTTRTVTGSRHVLITVTAVTVILIRHSERCVYKKILKILYGSVFVI